MVNLNKMNAVLQQLLLTINKDKPRKVCKQCHELSHTKVSVHCPYNQYDKQIVRCKIKRSLLQKNCLDDISTDEMLEQLSKELQISFNLCKTLYSEIPPIELILNRPLQISSFIEELQHQRITCHECNQVMYDLTCNRVWQGYSICEICWLSHEEERIQRWAIIYQHRQIKCEICQKEKMHQSERFHFDHLNMFEKVDSVSTMINTGTCLEDVLTEMNRCQILCVYCHEVVTKIERKLGFTRIKQLLTRQLNQNQISDDEYKKQYELCQTTYENKMKNLYEMLKENHHNGL